MYYKFGGSLKHNHPTYVERKADKQLLQLLQAGEYCSIFNSRQMGKSSLRVRASKKLRSLGIKSAFIDLTIIGNSGDLDIQIKGFASQLLSSLDLETEIDLKQWWEKFEYFTPLQKLDKIIDSIILSKIERQIVIFIDEIDSLLKSNFRDEFFAFIRACYNKRVDSQKYDRLCFCLLGVVSPNNLIQDKQGTPFNIGHAIDLTGLTYKEAKDALIPGLATVVDNPESILKEIFAWTGGQPFLTQKLCALTVENAANKQVNVKEIVEQKIINTWESQDVPEHLRTIRDRLIDDESKTIQLLSLYQRILRGEIITVDRNEEQIQLRLSGLVVKDKDRLQVYNPIYQRIFNDRWVEEILNNLRPYSTQINDWLTEAKNPQYLLSDKELTQAWEWSQGRKIGSLDYEFLSASQQYQSDREKQAKDILFQANQKAKQSIERGKIILSFALLSSLVIGLSSFVYARQQIQKAQTAELNRLAIESKQAFDGGRQLENLSAALTAVKKLQQQEGEKNIARYSTTKPIETLNYIINNINEINKIKISDNLITTLAVSDDNKNIVIGDESGNVKLWQSNNKQIKTITTFSDRITQVSFISAERILISNYKGKLELWDIKGEKIKTFQDKNVSTFRLTPDRQTILVGDKAGNLSFRSLDGKIINQPWQAHQANITDIAITSDGNTIATASEDTAISLWTREGKKIDTLTGHKNTINSLSFHPKNQILASASSDGTIKLWNINDREKPIKELFNYQNIVKTIAFSPDGYSLISAASDRTIKQWKINNSQKESGTLQTSWQKPNDITQLIYSPNGKTIISGDEAGLITIFSNPKRDRGIETATLSQDGKTIIYSNLAGITIENIDGTIINTLPPIPNKIINSIAFDSNQKLLVAGTEDGAIAKIDLEKDKAQWNFIKWNNDLAYQGEVIQLKLTDNGKYLLSLGLDVQSAVIKKWNIQESSLLEKINLDSEYLVVDFDYNNHNKSSIVAYNNGTIEYCTNNCQSNRNIIRLDKNFNSSTSNITKIRFHPSDRQFIVAYQDSTIELRQLDGTLISSFESQSQNIEGNIVNNTIEYLTFTENGDFINAIASNRKMLNWGLNPNNLLVKGCKLIENFASDICKEVN